MTSSSSLKIISPFVNAGLRVWAKCRSPLLLAFDLLAVVAANYFAFWLRFDCAVPRNELALFARLLPWLVIVRTLAFGVFRLYPSVWRYASTQDLLNIIKAAVASTIALWLVLNISLGFQGYPRSVYIIDPIILIFLLGGARLARRIVYNYERVESERRVLIYGAGDAGEMVARDMFRNPSYKLRPVGFIDDDPVKLGRRIHNVPVLGAHKDLVRVVKIRRPDQVLIAMANVDGRVIRSIVRTLEPFKVEIKTLPDVKSLLDGAITVSQVRPLVLEDLLARTPIQLDPQPVRNLVCGKRILVTGAGGSIGSELCRQIAPLGPTELLLYERHENGLYSIEKDLRDTHSECPLVPLLGDVTDAQRFESVLLSYKPDLIFHAAAHKHVPLMELNPCEAVKNNVVGTRVAIEAAHRHAVGQFILVSTDKTVNATSVMGATKRIAEFMAQSMAASSNTRFSVVRFGNVLGSNGSVVPRFVEQIKKGGPITVTHPEMRRFLMLIPEAVELLLHAAAMNERGSLYILNMGEQVKILDVARDLIRLSGLIPDEEIAIEFTGLRPGEKLSEELVEADEALEHSGVDKIFRVKPKTTPEKCWLWDKITELERRALDNDSAAVIELLCQTVVNFRPDFPAGLVTGHFPGIKDNAEAAERLRRILQPAAAILRY